jgi:hypothetical protein
VTPSPTPAGQRTQEIAVPATAPAPADPSPHGATAVGTAGEHPAPAAPPAPLPPPAYPVTAPQPPVAEAPTAVVPPAGAPQPTGPLDGFFGPPPQAAAPAAAPPAATAVVPEVPSPPRRVRAPRTPRERAVLLTTGLGVLALVLLELGLGLRMGGQVLWSDLPLWSAFATLATLVGVLGLAASLLPGGRLRPAVADRLALGGLTGLAVFWALIALPRVDSDRGFLLTAALGALGVAVWLSPARRRDTTTD